jgi:hypothetical protein
VAARLLAEIGGRLGFPPRMGLAQIVVLAGPCLGLAGWRLFPFFY